jgi:hypothetical protein
MNISDDSDSNPVREISVSIRRLSASTVKATQSFTQWKPGEAFPGKYSNHSSKMTGRILL